MQIGNFEFDFLRKTYVMGILNVTPDSFSDGGQFIRVDQALYHVEQMVREGADVIDIGGESTRPGAALVSLDEELARILPIIERISREIAVPISVDTYKAEVARQAVDAGAHLINDVWGAKADPLMARVVAEAGVPIVLMHNRKEARYQSFYDDVQMDLQESIEIVKRAGVADEQIILDPGIGFAKSLEENLLLMRNLDKIVAMGYPVLLGISRKSMIGQVLDLPTNERLEGTVAANSFGIAQGCGMIRVHDVAAGVRTARMMDAMMGRCS